MAVTERVIVGVAEVEKLDLVHVHYAIPHAVAALLVKDIVAPRKLPLVTTLHGTDMMMVGIRPELRRTCAWALAASDETTAVSTWLADLTQAGFPDLARPRVIHNFVDTERYTPRASNRAARAMSRWNWPTSPA